MLHGSLIVQGQCYVWDYAAETAILAQEMPLGSTRHATSERMKWASHAVAEAQLLQGGRR